MRHGTSTGYTRYKCRCWRCRAWNAAAWQRKKARLAATAFDKIPHGLNGYNAYSCRCETCKAAKRDANVKRCAPETDAGTREDSAPVLAA